MADELNDRKIAMLAADGVEQVELEQPREAVENAGGTVELLSLEEGEIQAVNSEINPADKFAVDRKVADVSPGDYDGLILPGGCVNPDNLRVDADAIEFVQAIAQAGKPIAAICHAPWVLVEADLVNGRTLTSYPSVRTDIRNAGGEVVDEEVVVDEELITSRNPDDLPAFCEAIVKEFARVRPLEAAQ